jgi:aminoglycoside phosphotransferase (APT) family kinase protein
MFEASQRDNTQVLCSSINNEALYQVVAGLTGGKRCSADNSFARVGGANYHARIVFKDQSPSWLVRIPRGGWPSALEQYLVRSESATLKFLQSTKLPAPRPFGYHIRGGESNDVGVSYLLMEVMPGKVWCEGHSARFSAAQELEKVLSGVADLMIELHRHSFDIIGSLQDRSSHLEVTAFASDQTLILGPSGPFKDSWTYYTAYAEQYLALIADEQTYTRFPVEAYLVYAYLKDNVDQLCPIASSEPERFFLKHIHDKGDHLMVDKKLDIVGVIDWLMARIAPANEAFGPSIITADMKSPCGGKNGLSSKDRLLADILRQKGAVTLANIMSANEKVRRFIWGLGAETDWGYAQLLAEALLEAFDGGGEDVASEQWKEVQLRIRHVDIRLAHLLGRVQRRSLRSIHAAPSVLFPLPHGLVLAASPCGRWSRIDPPCVEVYHPYRLVIGCLLRGYRGAHATTMYYEYEEPFLRPLLQ